MTSDKERLQQMSKKLLEFWNTIEEFKTFVDNLDEKRITGELGTIKGMHDDCQKVIMEIRKINKDLDDYAPAHDIGNALLNVKSLIDSAGSCLKKSDLTSAKGYIEDVAAYFNVLKLIIGLYAEATASPGELVKFDITAILNETCELFRQSHRDIEVSTSFDDKIPPFYSRTRNRREFMSTVMNILWNFPKHAWSEGEYARRDKKVSVKSKLEGNQVTIKFENNGQPVEEGLDIFREGVKSEKTGGTGWGLGLAHEFAKDAGGDLTCSSSEDETQFKLTFDIKKLERA